MAGVARLSELAPDRRAGDVEGVRHSSDAVRHPVPGAIDRDQERVVLVGTAGAERLPDLLEFMALLPEEEFCLPAVGRDVGGEPR